LNIFGRNIQCSLFNVQLSFWGRNRTYSDLARGAESGQKDLKETSVWLRIVSRISRENSYQIVVTFQENFELARIIMACIRTAKAHAQAASKMTIEQ
jgi:hypothetical protein